MPEPRGEFARIAALLAGWSGGEGVVVGPGDDAAVLRPRAGRDLVITTDTFVEGRHFRRDLLTPTQVGARLAAANLSDLAAMAAEPRWALISLVVPERWSEAECEALERSCADALAAEGATLVGGNLCAGSGELSATVVLLGEVETNRAWTRAGARAGDVLAVTGVPGSAAAVLSLSLCGNPPEGLPVTVPPALLARYLAPPSRVRVARALAQGGSVRAAIDISDGLAADLAHLCAASGVGAVIEAPLVPADAALREAARALVAHRVREQRPAHGGESEVLDALRFGASDDYELLLAVDSAKWDACAAISTEAGAILTRIGRFTIESGIRQRAASGVESPLLATGWDHFA